MGAAAAAMVVAERRIIEVFERAGATSPETARTPDELGVDTIGLGWRRLSSRAVVRETSHGSGRYYFDREVWQAVRRTRHRVALAIVVLLLGIWLYVATMGVVHGSSRMQQTTPAQVPPAR